MSAPIPQNVYLVANGTGTIFPTIIQSFAPTTNDINFPIGQRWINTSNNNAEYFLLNFNTTQGYYLANWVLLGSSNIVSSFAPQLQFGGSSVGITYALQQGEYTRSGNLVFFNLSIILTNKGPGFGTNIATVLMPGLPNSGSTVVNSNTTLSSGNLTYTSGYTYLMGVMFPTTNVLSLYQFGSTDPSNTPLTYAAFINTSSFTATGFYFTV